MVEIVKGKTALTRGLFVNAIRPMMANRRRKRRETRSWRWKTAQKDHEHEQKGDVEGAVWAGGRRGEGEYEEEVVDFFVGVNQ